MSSGNKRPYIRKQLAELLDADLSKTDLFLKNKSKFLLE